MRTLTFSKGSEDFRHPFCHRNPWVYDPLLRSLFSKMLQTFRNVSDANLLAKNTSFFLLTIESQDLIILAYTDGQDSNSDVNHNSKDSGVFFGENDTLASQKMFHL